MKNKMMKKWLAVVLAFSMASGSASGLSVQAAGETAGVEAQALTETTQNYQNNQGKLKENPLIQLPLGAVQAESWLENQLLLMKNGITGHMKEFHDYNDQGSAWLGYEGSDANTWENGPYFVRGLTALAYALNDQELTEEALDWLEWAINSQQSNGYFGPTQDNSWWSRMPMLCAIRDFYEAVGQKPVLEQTQRERQLQGKVLDFFESYFRYQVSELPNRPLSNWADARGGDNLEIVYWLYNQLYDEANPENTDWLLNLGDLIYSQTNDWESIYNDTTVRTHVVNTSQGMKTPAVYSQYKDGEQYKTALSNGLDNMGIDHGRIDGLPNSDEAARENRSTRGSETCGIVEGLLSTEIVMSIQGESWIGDRIETLAYNALPAAYPSDYSGHTYYILQNQVMNTLGNHEFDCDHGDSSAFGAPDGYDCCFANNHMGWAKFVQNMWMAKANGGLAIVAYGPNNVTAKVADGKTAKFTQTTDYPFKDTVQLDYCGETASFDLDLRIPEWAKSAKVTVNGVVQEGVTTGSYYTVNRVWKSGDQVQVTFQSEVELTTWYNNSTAVQKGALIYGLQIEEDWRTYDENDARELKVEHNEELPLREVYPASDWNYGLVTDSQASFEVVEEEEVGLQPFSSDQAPVKIIAKGVQLPEWTLDGNIAGPQPYGPNAYEEDQIESITLVPYGCQRLRITHFPTMNNEQETDQVVRTESNQITRNGITYQDFDNIVVPKAQNYSLKVTAEGTGTMIINSKYTQEVSGSFQLDGLKGLLSGSFQFTDGQYNNIRFTGDIQVSKVEVDVVNREITQIQVLNVIRSGSNGKILTNLDAQETPYRVVYGTESGNYTTTVRGFSSGTATLQGLDENTTYYAKVIAAVCGQEQESKEIVLEASEDQGGLKPNPNVPAATYEGFSTLNYMTGTDGLWSTWGDAVVAAQAHPNTTRASEIQFGSSAEQKAVLVAQGAQNWVDYVVEADLTLDEVKGNNAGVMFRATDIGEGADDYHGYYAGVGIANGKPGIMIGYADGGWHDLEIINRDDIEAGHKYTIKVVVYSNMFAVYLDGELVKVMEDDRFSMGTVGLRSYKVPFTGHDVRVRSVTEEDLSVFEELVSQEPEGLTPHENHEITPYEGFAATAEETKESFTFYDPQEKIETVLNDSGVQMNFGKGPRVKAVLNTEGSEGWIDYVAEARLSVDVMDTNNCGILFRGTQIGDDPDEYQGYFAGIGVAPRHEGTVLMIGYADGEWHDIEVVPWEVQPGQEYTLKVVAYDEQFAIYIDGELAYRFTDERFAAGTAGLRSYNEAFSVYDFTVRNITQEDLAVFEEEEEEDDEPVVIPELTDELDTDEAWTKVGDAGLFSIGDGWLTLGRSTNVKAVTGEQDWSDMVYTADVMLKDGTGNAGLLVRSTREGSGADNYYGYYFGINGKEYEVGKSSNTWKQLKTGELILDTEQIHQLKVVAYKETFLFYVDEELVCLIQDEDHKKGRVGIRGYNRSITVDRIEVRGLTEEEKEEVVKQEELSRQMEISGYSAWNSIQVKYPRITNATSYRILFGTESGNYTNEFTEIYFNGYKGSGIFTHDKAAFSTIEPGTYYIQMLAMNGNTVVGYSNEIAVTTGERESTQAEAEKLEAVRSLAKSADLTEFTTLSLARLEKAKAYANQIAEAEYANQMQYATAADLLQVALNTPNSKGLEPEQETADKSELEKYCQEYQDKNESDYTPESWSAFAKALQEALEALEDEAVDQDTVDQILEALKEAAQGLVKQGQVTQEDLEEAVRKAQAAQKAAEEAERLAKEAQAEAEELAKEAEEAKRLAEEAKKKAEEMADASEAEKEAAQKAAQEAADRAAEAEEAAKKAEQAVTLAKDAQAKAEEASRLAQAEAEALRSQLEAIQTEIDKAREEAQKAKEEAQKARKEAEEAAKEAEEALKALQERQNQQQTAQTTQTIQKGQKYQVGNLEYQVTSTVKKEVRVTGPAKKNVTKVTIPATITLNNQAYKVTSIAKKAFYNQKKLTKVTIGKNVKTIGKQAFYKSGKLKSITIKTTKLQKIGKKAFSGISKKATFKLPKKKAKKYRSMM